MRSVLHRTTTALACAAFSLGALVVAPATAVGQETEAITCNGQPGSNATKFYKGKSAGLVYDTKFRAGAPIPGLGAYVPQGIAVLENWDGSGRPIFLISEYANDGKSARIYGLDTTGREIGYVQIAGSHVGGIAVARGWVFVSGRADGTMHTIRKYKASDLVAALKRNDGKPFKQNGTARSVKGASFLTSYNGTLFAGTFDGKKKSSMQSYYVAADGKLTEVESYEVPRKTQGVMITRDHFIFSTSYGRQNRSNIYVVDAFAKKIEPSAKCFSAPSMSEGMTTFGGYAVLLYESGSDEYAKPKPRNVIKHLHVANIATLPYFQAG
ncbi:hypothetical protein AB0L13_00120 [Saccharopolyspora shandongensis]|uniref:hypothetical protein n=1 Tax=Saccharopolyspora shandongensis TaxID=418495 RepID=UPI003441169F